MNEFELKIKDEVEAALLPLLRAIVNDKGGVYLDISFIEKIININVNVNKKDVGFCIGKQGKNAEALRLLSRAISAKYGYLSMLEIIDNNKTFERPRTDKARAIEERVWRDNV